MAALIDSSGGQGYGHFLLAIAYALLPIEAALEQGGIAAYFSDWSERRRAPALIDDLAHLGLEATVCAATPDLRDPCALFGMLYVLEGSRLGSTVLLKNLGRRPDAAKLPLRYLLRSADIAPWKSFVVKLESVPELATRGNRVLEAAQAAFALFEQGALSVAYSPSIDAQPILSEDKE